MERLHKFFNRHFMTDELPFDSRMLNFVCLFGMIASGIALISRLIAGLPFITMVPLLLMIAAIFGIFFISIKGAKYATALTTLIVCGVSIIFWPMLFFTIGGHGSGMAVYFALAIILDMMLLKGKARVFAIIVTLAVTVICYISTLFWGWHAFPEGGLSSYQLFIDLMQSIFIVGFLVGIIILYQTGLYQNERDKAEAAGKETNDAAARLKAVVANYPGAICSADKDFNITLFDGLLVPHLIDKALFFAGQDLSVALQKDEYTHIMANLHKTISDGPQEWSFEANGKALHMTTTPIFNEQNEVTGLVAKIEDITEIIRIQKDLQTALDKAEAAVSASESARITTSAMFSSNPQINILFDNNFKMIDCNPAALSFFGFKTKEDLLAGFLERVTKSIPALQPDGRPSIPLAERLMTTVKEGSVKFETELHVSAGEIRNLSVEFKRIPYGESFAVVGYVFDMTDIHRREMELKQRDQQLSEAVEEAKMANLAKSNFLATMSHEIRTPMNAILGITEIQLQKENIDQDVLDALTMVSTSGDMLLGIINDILDLSKIEAGKLELVIDKYEIASLISDTAQLNMMRIGSKPIEFELNVDENVPSILSGDALRVKQILNNVLSNAFKYTAEGTVTLSVYAEPDADNDDNVTLVFSVVDTGQGMTSEQVGKLFDKYSRFNMEANRSTEGTGLGMSITQNLIQLMHGELIIDSEVGQGSTFVIRIPQHREGSGVLGEEIIENLHNFRTSSRAQMRRVQITREPMPYGSVLIVDDVETNIFVAKGLLAPYKLKIDSVDSGFAAIERVKNGYVYDIVFMDHMMPKMDGIETTRIIRSIGYDHPIVALTANAVSGQAEIFLGNGFNDFISKPIDIRQLNTVLCKFVRDKQPSDILAAVKKQAKKEQAASSNNFPWPGIKSKIVEVFSRDALKTLATLEAISSRNDYSNENDMRAYIINVHGIKSALANIGNLDLSAEASKLETAGREGNLDLIMSETPAFLNELRAFAEELTSDTEPATDENIDEDTAFLHEKLLAIKAACEEYNENSADSVLTELKQTTWSHKTNELLGSISELLLHSEFDEIADAINAFTANAS